MNKKFEAILIYSICHFIVDFLCALFMIGKIDKFCISNNEYIIAFIIYNFFAFAFQVPIGYTLDKLRINKLIAPLGICLIMLCFLDISRNAILISIILGLGNALFHLEGGINIYEISKKRATLNGIFVAPGALGIFIGTYFSKRIINTLLPTIYLIIALILLIYVQRLIEDRKIKNLKSENKKNTINCLLIILLIGISIIVRSIGTSFINYPWKNSFVLSLVFTLCVVAGKALGGIIGEKINYKKTLNLSLILSIPFLIMGYSVPVFGYIGILMFNIPMAITLTIIENSMKNNIGVAVGLNTMFLFLGYIFSFIKFSLNSNFIFIICMLIAILSINFAIRIYKLERREPYEYKKI